MIELKNVSKTFDSGTGEVDALKNVTLTINDGDIYGIIGMSGAGKSTLVRCINLLEKPSSGEIIVNGERLDTMSPAQLRAARRNITMIFQHFNLLMQRTCLKNICFPMELAGVKKAEAEKRARELLELVGLPDKANAYPAQLSGGQQQRIAIARALATDPKVLLCDEATSALDPKTTRQILELIKDINRKLGITVVIITHQMSVVKEVCNHVAILDDGEVAEEGLVAAVFAAPKSPAGRRLVFPGGVDEMVSDPKAERRVRLIFRDSQTTAIPLVARLASEENIFCNIISASTQKLSEEVYGSLLIGIPSAHFDRALQTSRQRRWTAMYSNLFSEKSVQDLISILPSLPTALWETFYVTVLSTALSLVIGLPLGVLLVTGEKDGVLPLPGWLMHLLNIIINLLRSIPFLILMIMVLPLSRALIGTAVGTTATIVPLVAAAFPFVARLVESSLRELDGNIIEAAQSMGASPFQIICKVMIPESVPSLIQNVTIALTTILSYSAMSGIIGGGGLGKIAIDYGYYRYKYLIMVVAVIILILLVQFFQSLGTYLAKKSDKRLK